jgi:hypothetical protein
LGFALEPGSVEHVLRKYEREQRIMKSCEPRDLLNRISDICLFEGIQPKLTTELIDLAWQNYFGTSHTFEPNISEAVPEASLQM